MAVLPIRRFPDPLLKRPTHPVRRIDAHAARLINSMIATMHHYPHCVGLAAPQVGSSLRIAVMDASRSSKATTHHGLVVLVNPTLELGPEFTVGREGCMSLPDFTGNAQRSTRALVKALDRSGEACEWIFEGFEAIVAQHEVDHLDGLLFLDRVANLQTDLFRRKTYR